MAKKPKFSTVRPPGSEHPQRQANRDRHAVAVGEVYFRAEVSPGKYDNVTIPFEPHPDGGYFLPDAAVVQAPWLSQFIARWHNVLTRDEIRQGYHLGATG